MILLAIESSSFDGGIALMDTEQARAVAVVEFSSKVNHSRKLLDSIQFALDKSELTLKDIGAVGVAVGPGSFTGVRIGLTHAKMLAWTRRIPLIGIGTLDGIAARQPAGATVCALIPARGGEVYAGIYNTGLCESPETAPVDLESRMTPFCAPILDALHRIAEWAGSAELPADRIVFAGPGAERYLTEIRDQFPHARIAEPWLRHASAVSIGLLAMGRLSDNELDDPVKLEPMYLRAEHEEFKAAPPEIDV